MLGGGEADVRDVARAVGGDSGTGLPGGFGDEEARASATSGDDVATRRTGLVPCSFGDVAERGDQAGVVRGRPVERGIGCVRELGATHACNVGAGTEGVDAELLGGGRGGEAGVAGGGAGVHGADEDGDAFGGGLGEEGVPALDAGGAGVGLATAEADVHDGIVEGVDLILRGGEDASAAVGQNDKVHLRVGRGAQHALNVHGCFGLVPASGISGIGTCAGNDNVGGGIGGEASVGLELGDVRADDARAADDGDPLAEAGEAGEEWGVEVEDGAEVAGGDVVVLVVGSEPGLRSGRRCGDCLAVAHGLDGRVRKAVDGLYDGGEGGRECGVLGGGEARLAVEDERMEAGGERGGDRRCGAVDGDEDAAGRDF